MGGRVDDHGTSRSRRRGRRRRSPCRRTVAVEVAGHRDRAERQALIDPDELVAGVDLQVALRVGIERRGVVRVGDALLVDDEVGDPVAVVIGRGREEGRRLAGDHAGGVDPRQVEGARGHLAQGPAGGLRPGAVAGDDDRAVGREGQRTAGAAAGGGTREWRPHGQRLGDVFIVDGPCDARPLGEGRAEGRVGRPVRVQPGDRRLVEGPEEADRPDEGAEGGGEQDPAVVLDRHVVPGAQGDARGVGGQAAVAEGRVERPVGPQPRDDPEAVDRGEVGVCYLAAARQHEPTAGAGRQGVQGDRFGGRDRRQAAAAEGRVERPVGPDDRHPEPAEAVGRGPRRAADREPAAADRDEPGGQVVRAPARPKSIVARPPSPKDGSSVPSGRSSTRP